LDSFYQHIAWVIRKSLDILADEIMFLKQERSYTNLVQCYLLKLMNSLVTQLSAVGICVHNAGIRLVCASFYYIIFYSPDLS